jgi:hypothetical protein
MEFDIANTGLSYVTHLVTCFQILYLLLFLPIIIAAKSLLNLFSDMRQETMLVSIVRI